MSSMKHVLLKVQFILCSLCFGVICSIVYLDHTKISHPINKDIDITAIEARNQRGLEQNDTLDRRIAECMESTHISNVQSLVRDAKTNARYLYREFRKVIPQNSLEGYRSHCWNGSYFTQWDESRFTGRINNISFAGEIEGLVIPRRTITYLKEIFPQRNIHSSLLCIPRLFLAGFPKCGSSFVHCLISKFISISTYGVFQPPTTSKKEPHFWVMPNLSKKAYTPMVDSLGQYLFYFLPGLKQIVELNRKEVILIDSKVNKLFMWPQFKKSQQNLTNYCLLPSVLPELLPGSKYIVIMRNPVSMLYSAFWNSCSRLKKMIPMTTQLKGPDLFHSRVMKKINMFNNCMRDDSIPDISEACRLDRQHNFTSCILQPERLLLLDKCTQEINFNIYTPELPNCGRSRIAMGLYFVHVRKWLSVVSKQEFLFLTLEDLSKNLEMNVHRVLKFLNLKTDISDKSLKATVELCGTNPQKMIDYKNNPRLQMREDTRKVLESFYRPFNFLLRQLIESDTMFNHW